MVKLIKLAKMAGVMHTADPAYSIRSRALGYNIDYPLIYHSKPVLLIRPVLLRITWISRILFQNLDRRILEFLPSVSCWSNL